VPSLLAVQTAPFALATAIGPRWIGITALTPSRSGSIFHALVPRLSMTQTPSAVATTS
jgi:hypothetical protein